MLSLSAAGLEGASPAIIGSAIDLGRGAIAGAMIISAAYLAGFAVFKRGSAAAWALVMVLSASALLFSWLGLFPFPSAKVSVLLQGIFGASAIVFLSSTLRAARTNSLLGGLMFAAALTLVGLGVINFGLRADASGLMRVGLMAAGVFVVILSLLQAPRDFAARLILPGALVTLAAPFVGLVFGDAAGSSLAPQALFALGVVSASFVSLAERPLARRANSGLLAEAPGVAADLSHGLPPPDPQEALRISENQLAQVLDYAGVAVWDWSPEEGHQTEGLPAMIGAQSGLQISPETLRGFIHKDELAKFETRVLGDGGGDGSFDTMLKLRDGRQIRMRGARAVGPAGDLERLVGFFESAVDAMKGRRAVIAPASSALVSPMSRPELHTGAAVQDRLAARFSDALAKGEVTTVFQPIVDLQTGRIAGYETLARWKGEEGAPDRAKPEDLVRAAEASGKGAELAELVLKAATRYLGAQQKAEKRSDLFVAMNLSVAQAREPSFPEMIRSARTEHGLAQKALVLELTESQAITDIADADQVFKALKDAGAALAFDDFGAGFSSLSNLQKYSFDYLKIDKSFVDALVSGGAGAKIARAIAELGRELGLTVIAEGVESKETAKAAKAIGCTLGQGYAFGAPSAESAGRNADSDTRASRMLWRATRR